VPHTSQSVLITEEYQKQQHQLHMENAAYGSISMIFAPVVSLLMNEANIKEVLDYGCGKGRLGQNLKVNHDYAYYPYDPALEHFASPPQPRELVCCIDVLEHIEPECLEQVLNHLQALTAHIGFFTIHTKPAKKTLSDGRNAHLIQQPMSWWLERMSPRFFILKAYMVPDGFVLIVKNFMKQ